MTENTVIALEKRIKAAADKKEIFIVAVDGRCASGKTTLAAALSERLGCDVIHTDDFYLQPHQRTTERYAEPGGNLDRERLIAEVLQPLRRGEGASYCPFICSAMSFGEKIHLKSKGIYIVEGSYSCHPEMRKYYDLTVFVTTDSQTQKERIKNRNGTEQLHDFLTKWIHLEEKYFAAFEVESKADAVIRSNQ